MTYRGKVKSGVVVLEGNAQIPDGTEVRVEPLLQEAGDEPAEETTEDA